MKKWVGRALLFSVLCLGAGAAHAAVTVNTQVPDTIIVLVPCANGGAGETVELLGDLHILISFTVNGNHASGNMHFQAQGISGVGSVTGDRYQATGVTQVHFEANQSNGQFAATGINNFRIIGQGPNNNFLVHEVVHVTFNANGIQTAAFDKATVDCK